MLGKLIVDIAGTELTQIEKKYLYLDVLDLFLLIKLWLSIK